MSDQNQHIALVNRIPVNQEAPAHYPVKKFLLEKMRTIFQNKQVIRNAAIQEQRKKILDAYKRSVGFNQKVKILKSLKDKLKKAEETLIQVGLSEAGTLLEVTEYWNGVKNAYQIRWNQEWLQVEDSIGQGIEKVKELMKAVEGETRPYDIFDQLETRMMMASKVGELMAIVNAVAEEPIFNIKKELLLSNGSQQ